jgi:hypothetical protein
LTLNFKFPQLFAYFCSPLFLWLAFLVSVCNLARADDTLRVSGFGTLGYANDDRSDLSPNRDLSQKAKNGAATGASWRLDSRLGVQLEYSVNRSMDLVGQFVVRDQYKSDVESVTELLYLSFRPHTRLDFRVGRINFDAFLMSDHRNVGYAYSWVRPPAEFYAWIPIFSMNGIDAAYNLQSKDVHWRIKAQAGNSSVTLPIVNGYKFKAQNMLGLSVTRQSELWRIKASYSQLKIDDDVPAFAPLHQGLDFVVAVSMPAVSAEAADLIRQLSYKNARIKYTTLGAVFDDGIWLAQAEIAHTATSAEAIPHGEVGYVSVGRRIDDWTPFVLLSASRPKNKVHVATNDWGVFNSSLRDPAVFSVNQTRIEQRSLSIGTRYDFTNQMALKLQWTHSVIKPFGYALWWTEPQRFDKTTRVNQISASFDFTF